ncbi:hypothetical protein Sp245p_17265 (plasmid) [Azospirillum baldaniorum]|uniref:Uncharacterized protein n=1 Tax=Azospirillum baldaniorum TaxID=1064539 RepID=A0A9P1JUD6_9PROT|nr:hypothetical protein Sp245p_17265 [Azospirillum baldaniorum]CCC99908.1 protein of unknown function [Azospirillum baldaniorum]
MGCTVVGRKMVSGMTSSFSTEATADNRADRERCRQSGKPPAAGRKSTLGAMIDILNLPCK